MSFLMPQKAKALPGPAAAPPAPDRTDDEINAAAAEQRRRYGASLAGRSSTQITGGQGDSTGYGIASKLLGG
jgi:hypothetical protein